MKTAIAGAAALLFSTAIANAHTAVVSHAHPHEAAHAYAGLETIAFAAIGALIGVTAYVYARKLAKGLIGRRT